MPAIVIVGAQWGDEGKGKIVDFLAQQADCVVRYNGGSNAGHTVRVGNRTFRLSLIPSGALRRKQLFIGNGVVIDPEVLLKEIDELEGAGIKLKLFVSERAHITFSFHRTIDGLEEEFRSGKRRKEALGTTKRGVGPTYSDKAARFGIRAVDLLDKKVLQKRLTALVAIKRKIVKNVFHSDIVLDEKKILKEYLNYGKKLSPYLCDVSLKVNEALDKNQCVLFEGAQGFLLDIDHGTYPFVTSSNTVAGSVCSGVGISPQKIDEIIGVVKVYTTRIGTGPFPTEIKGRLAERIREKGDEFGTVTGRPRRIGWLDAVALKYAAMVNGFTSLAITKLDVLGGIDPLRVCVKYRYAGKTIKTMPAALEKCKPIYIELEGWSNLSASEWMEIAKKGYSALPKKAKKYLETIEKLIGVPIKMISVGPEREATVVKDG